MVSTAITVRAHVSGCGPYKAHSIVSQLGDNPYSDIQGANAYGFSSILVRTGVFRGKDNHHEHPATSVQADVLVGGGITIL